MNLVSLVNQSLGFLTVFGQLIIGATALAVLTRKNKFSKNFLKIISKNSLLFSFIVALAATLGSLFYSEVAGYEPCKLCWYQRIFMYPQIVLLAQAVRWKDYKFSKYSLSLSIPGAAVAAYHYLLQVGVVPGVTCTSVGYSISCSQRFVMQFGYITIPMMALTAFLLIIVFNLTKYD